MSAILSVRQPWAWAIVNGWKRVENRTWQTRHRGPLVIHAGTREIREDVHYACRLVSDQTGRPLGGVEAQYARENTRGAIVGTCELAECGHADDQTRFGGVHPPEIENWLSGPWCFVLDNARQMESPIPWRGRLGIWHEPIDTLIGGLK